MTAETAVVLPALALLLVLAMWGVALVGQQLRCIDAARVAARALARGEPEPLARAAAAEAAPPGARLSVSRHDGLVVVEVDLTARLPGRLADRGADIRLGSRAVAAVEGP